MRQEPPAQTNLTLPSSQQAKRIILLLAASVALLMPALSAYYLDISAEQHRSRIMGFKESSAALGGVTGPLLVTGLSGLLTSTGVFMIAFLLLMSTAGVAMVFLRVPPRYQCDRDEFLERASIVP